jgi:hypothetical protein
MARIFNTLTLDHESAIEHGMAYDADLGWDSVPCIRMDGFTILVRDNDALHKLLGELARLGVAMNERVAS